MRWLLVVGLVLGLSGCVSEETRQLAQGMRDFQEMQRPRIERLVEYAFSKEAISKDERKKMLEDQAAIKVGMRSLSEILGEPKEPVEVDKW